MADIFGRQDAPATPTEVGRVKNVKLIVKNGHAYLEIDGKRDIGLLVSKFEISAEDMLPRLTIIAGAEAYIECDEAVLVVQPPKET